MGEHDRGRRDASRRGPAGEKYQFRQPRSAEGGPRQEPGHQQRPAGGGRYDRDASAPRATAREDHRPPRGENESRRVEEPPLDEDATSADLSSFVRSRLRTLSKGSAERVARHLVMAGRLLYEDPETAYRHAQAAVRRAGRVDVVREAAALTAYSTGRYAEALREVRTARRLSGVDNMRAVEADCERGLGRPERALDLAAAPPSKDMSDPDRVELAIVASGARLDMDQPEAALLELDTPLVRAATDPEVTIRVAQARATVLRALGRREEADKLEASLPAATTDPTEQEITMFSLPATDTGAADE